MTWTTIFSSLSAERSDPCPEKGLPHLITHACLSERRHFPNVYHNTEIYEVNDHVLDLFPGETHELWATDRHVLELEVVNYPPELLQRRHRLAPLRLRP